MTLLDLVVLSAATYRITRFTQLDSLIEDTRDRLALWLSQRGETLVWRKTLDFMLCAFCVSVWVAGFIVLFWAAVTDYDLAWRTLVDWLAVAAGGMVFYRYIDPPQ